MTGDLTGRIVTAVFLLQIDTRNFQRHHLLRQVRRKMAAQIDKFTILALPQQAPHTIHAQPEKFGDS